MALKALTVTPSRNERAYQATKEAIFSLDIRPREFLAIGDLANYMIIAF